MLSERALLPTLTTPATETDPSAKQSARTVEPVAPKVKIPLFDPTLSGNEWRYVKECLDTNWVSTAGTFVDRFEREFATYLGTRQAVATVSGTAALHVSLLVADIKPDDEVLVSTLSFIAPANAIRYVGAWPVFVDSEPEYWQMDSQKVIDFLNNECRWNGSELRNKKTGRRVKAIMPVHILGHPVNMDPILEIARRYNLVVIEDATESLGAKYKGRLLGCLGDIACFSFNGNKIITTGGGGMIVTNNKAWATKAKYLTTQAKDDSLEYIHNEIGYNYRLTNIQAALGCAQFEQLSNHIAAKRKMAANYVQALQSVPGITPVREAPWASSIFWMFTVQVDPVHYGIDSRMLMAKLDAAGVQSRPLWQPLHQNQAHSGSLTLGGKVSERLNRNCLNLPSSVSLDRQSLDRVIREIIRISGKRSSN